MLRREELAIIKVVSNIELSSVFLRELRKAVAAGKKRAISATKAIAASASALEGPSGVGGEARTSRDHPRLHVSKRKAEELSTSDYPSEPARRWPTPGHLFDDGHVVQGTTGVIGGQSMRQLDPT
jgi:hypothetical protein